MSESIVQVNEEATSADLRGLVRKTVEETLNAFLDKEAGTGSGRFWEPPKA